MAILKVLNKAVNRLNTLPSIARLALFILVLATLIFMGAAYAADCGNPGSPTPVFWLDLNESTGASGTTLDDVCGTNDFQRLSTTERVTGWWNGAQSWKKGDSDRAYNYSTAAMGITNGNFTARALIKPISDTGGASNEVLMVGNNSGTAKYNYMYMLINNINRFHCVCGTGTGYNEIYTVGVFEVGKWYDFECIFNGTRLAVWLNGTYNISVAATCGGGLNGTVQLGAYDIAGTYAFNGTIDEVAFWQTDLSQNTTWITNLYNNNYINAPANGTVGCSITLNNYPDGYHTNDDNPNLNYSITCYDSMPTSCQANTNDSTVFSLFSTPPTNGTSKILTLYETFLQPLADGNYTWNVSCTNTTLTNFSETRSFIIDTVSPVLTFTNPANNSQYAYNTTLNNLSVVCQDLNVYNLSVAIVNDSGQQSIYTNSTPGGVNLTYLTLTNTFTSGLSQGAYWAVANCSDSHTGKHWKAEEIYNDTIQFKVRKGSDWVTVDFDNSTNTSFTEQQDRVKWGFTATVNNNSNIREVVKVRCDAPLYLVNPSIAHFVCGNYWIDFADLADQGYSFEIDKVNDYKYKIKIKKNGVGAPGDKVFLDPAVGGLSWTTETHNFTISYAPTVTLTYPVNLTVACWFEPCETAFIFTPASFIDLTAAQLYGNFSGAWAANATNQTDLINGTSNTITVNLSRGFYAWNVRVNDSINASFAAVNLTLGLVAPTIGTCNGTAGAAAINFTFYNEENVSVPIYANMSAVIDVYNYERTYNLTVNGSWTNTTNVTLCVYPSNTSIVLDSFQEYNGSFAGFSKREYFLRNATLPAGLVVTVPLYALPYSLSSLLSVTVVSQILPVENAYITFERYYSDLNQYIGVGMAKTNEDGLGSAYIQPNSIYYRMVIEKDFTVLKTTTSTKFAASTITVDVSESGQSEYFRYSNGVAFNCSFNGTTDLIVCQVIDTSGLVPAVRFTAYEQTPFSTSPVCYNRTTSTASVVFFCDISNITNPVVYSLVAEAPESDILLWGGTVQSGATAAVFGDVGLFASVGVIAGIAFLGLITPPMLIVMGAFGLVVTVAMGLMNLSLAGIIAVGFLAALLLARMRE